MKSVAVIGAAGFIGSNLSLKLREKGFQVDEISRSTKMASFSGKRFDAVFFCAGNSKTYVSIKDPMRCLKESVVDLYQYLKGLEYKKFILVSSVVVYPQDLPIKKEEAIIPLDGVSIYGAHKLLAERYVKEFAPSWVIARATGFFGEGLKKNLLYDIKNNSKDIYIHPDSWIDYMPAYYFAEILVELTRETSNEVFNVGSGCSIKVRDLLALGSEKYSFHSERFHDDRGLRFDKLRQYCPQVYNESILLGEICSFIGEKKSDE